MAIKAIFLFCDQYTHWIPWFLNKLYRVLFIMVLRIWFSSILVEYLFSKREIVFHIMCSCYSNFYISNTIQLNKLGLIARYNLVKFSVHIFKSIFLQESVDQDIMISFSFRELKKQNKSRYMCKMLGKLFL